jgi:hypothetical protein
MNANILQIQTGTQINNGKQIIRIDRYHARLSISAQRSVSDQKIRIIVDLNVYRYRGSSRKRGYWKNSVIRKGPYTPLSGGRHLSNIVKYHFPLSLFLMAQGRPKRARPEKPE